MSLWVISGHGERAGDVPFYLRRRAFVGASTLIDRYAGSHLLSALHNGPGNGLQRTQRRNP
jgi:hypothetical protein